MGLLEMIGLFGVTPSRTIPPPKPQNNQTTSLESKTKDSRVTTVDGIHVCYGYKCRHCGIIRENSYDKCTCNK